MSSRRTAKVFAANRAGRACVAVAACGAAASATAPARFGLPSAPMSRSHLSSSARLAPERSRVTGMWLGWSIGRSSAQAMWRANPATLS
jgi:hypothetical protein